MTKLSSIKISNNMKKLCFLTAALLTAGIMTAQVQLSELPGRVITPQKVNLTEAPAK